MSIWRHDESAPLIKDYFGSWPSVCPHCSSTLRELGALGEIEVRDADITAQFGDLVACDICGWWRIHRQLEGWFGDSHQFGGTWHRRGYGAAGALRNLDLSDIDLPLAEIKSYLVARYQARFEVHPRLFEEVVCDVMRDVGYAAITTAYSGDGGIDVVLEGKDGATVGIQVKRWQRKISVEQIRSFVGALLLGGYTRGIFVTTSSFQRGATQVAANAREFSMGIELVDAPRFYDALRFSRVPSVEGGYLDEVIRSFADLEKLWLIWRDIGGCNSNATYDAWGGVSRD